MLVNLLFPFEDKLLRNYKKKRVSIDDRKRFKAFSAVLLCALFVFVYFGSFPAYAKAILLIPAFVGITAAVFCLVCAKNDETFFLGIVFSILSLDFFVMVICAVFSRFSVSLKDICFQMLCISSIFLILLVTGYRMHFFNQLKKDGDFEKIPWNNTYTAIIVIIGVSLSKVLTPTWMTCILWILWICIHISLSSIVLEYRKFKALSNQ